MDFSYPKKEKLKSRKTIDLLFREGKSLTKFPLRLVYNQSSLENNEPITIGVSVSKKYFKRAVDRNYIKRLLREAYRCNKELLAGQNSAYAIMLLYQCRELPNLADINTKVIVLFNRFADACSKAEL